MLRSPDGPSSSFNQRSHSFTQPRASSTTTSIEEAPDFLRSALSAEAEAARFAAAGRRGVILRLGLLDGPETGNDVPNPYFGATLHVADAGHALVAGLVVPSGVYNVCRDGERVSNVRFVQVSGCRPAR